MTAPTRSFAFYGRVSTEDAQDPSLSIPRQLAACQRALEPSGGEVVARYWDIESGRKALADRGQSADAQAVQRQGNGFPGVRPVRLRCATPIVLNEVVSLVRVSVPAGKRTARDRERRGAHQGRP